MAKGFVFSHITNEGQMQACAGLRYRRQIEAQDILVLTDIKKKHSSHAITQDLDIVETAQAAAFFRSDGLILTGSATGKTANLEEIKAVKAAVDALFGGLWCELRECGCVFAFCRCCDCGLRF